MFYLFNYFFNNRTPSITRQVMPNTFIRFLNTAAESFPNS